MTIEFVTGDIFTSNCEAIINTVNCEGKMGKGLAYQFKKKYPNMEREYVEKCKRGELRPGKLHIYQEKDVLIINFPTKDKWRQKSKLEFIKDGLARLVVEIINRDIKSIAIPPLGAGNGGLNWNDVKNEIIYYLNQLVDVKIFVYEPSSRVEQKNNVPRTNSEMLLLAFIVKDLEVKTNTQLESVIGITKVLSKNEIDLTDVKLQAKKLNDYKVYYRIKNYDELYTSLYNKMVSKSIESEMSRKLSKVSNVILLVNKYPNFSKEMVQELLEIERTGKFTNYHTNDIEEILLENNMVTINIFQDYKINYFQ